MSVILTVITDGRRPSTIESAIESVATHIGPAFDKCFLVDDSADPANAEVLDKEFPDFEIVHHEARRGLGGAVRSAWTTALDMGVSFLVHWEDDFVLTERVNIAGMINILRRNSDLAQIALKRTPVNPEEHAAGGFMQAHPELFTDTGSYVRAAHIFTLNPCIIPRRVLEVGLDENAPMLERDITDRLVAAGYHFGILGNISDPPRVTTTTHRSSGYRW